MMPSPSRRKPLARSGSWRKNSLGQGGIAFHHYLQSSSLFLHFFFTNVLCVPVPVAGAHYQIVHDIAEHTTASG
jgi:hypothetical protein